MKAPAIPDIHAAVIALEGIWGKESDADLIVCAGGTVDYGIYPKECIEWMVCESARENSPGNKRQLLWGHVKFNIQSALRCCQ